jgi:UDP-4-amino-4,6-dideoxy-N-acetyl-beta-L-altrosamine N-acetyltransferase
VQNPFLIGPNLYLRPPEIKDAEAVAPWFNDPEVRRTLKRSWPMSIAAEVEFLRGLRNDQDGAAFAIVLRASDQLIGVTGLHNFDHVARHAGFGITIGDKEHWGRGHGTEATSLILSHAFDTLNLNRVWLHVYEFNPRGIRVYEKLGFAIEGRLRQHVFRDGRYWDVLTMGILRDEWAQRRDDGARS